MTRSEGQIPGNFDELANWLLAHGLQFPPSELHGAVAGALSGGMRLPASQWAEFALALIGAPQYSDAVADGGSEAELAASVGGLAELTLAALTDAELQFQPFLPDDEEALAERTEALRAWCQGFLSGFGEAHARSDKPVSELPENAQESLNDMMAIAQASVGDEGFDDEDDDDDASGLLVAPPSIDAASEDDERDYVEVVEYLRLAALTVFTDCGWLADIDSAETGPGPGSLH